MSTQVAGVLKDPFERPLANTDIDIRTITNTFAVLPGATIKVTTNAQGEYNFILEPANYAVSVILDGRAVYQGAMSITSTTPPGTLPQLLKQAEMLSELPLNYGEYFQQVQESVKDDADRAEAAANGISDQVDEARGYAQQSAQSASASEQSKQGAQQALADTQVIANKFQNLDQAVTETQQNAAQTSQDAQQTASDRAAADAAAQRAENAAGSAETVNVRNLRVPTSETINALPAAATRANSFPSFDASGQSQVTSFSSVALLDSQGKVPLSNIPATVINETFPVASQAEMLALTAQQGDVANRTDINQSFILKSSPASTLANWIPLLGNPVFSVNQKTGVVSLNASDIKTTGDSSSGIKERSLDNKTLQTLSLIDFGATGNGITDDTDAVQAAFTWVSGSALGRKLILNPGIFILSKRISMEGSQCNAVIQGSSRNTTSFIWKSGSSSAGFLFGANSKIGRVYISGFTMNTKIVTTDSAIRSLHGADSDKQFTMTDVFAYGDGLTGTASNGYFGGGLLYLEDADAPIISDCSFYGVDGGKNNFLLCASGVSLVAKNNFLLVPHLVNVSCSYVGYAFNIESIAVPGVEGLIMDRCNGFCVFGIKITAANAVNSAYYPPQYNINNTQIEYVSTGFDLNHITAASFTNCTFLNHPISTTDVSYAGVMRDVNRAFINACYVEARPNTKTNGFAFFGACNGISVGGSIFSLNSGYVGILFGDTTRNSTQHSNILASSGTLYSNSSSSASTNTSEPYVNGGEYSQQVGSYIEKFGSVVINVDSNGSGTYNYTKAFPSSVYTLTLTNGDSGAPGGVNNGVEIQTSNQTGFVVKFEAAAAGIRRVNFIAKGK